MNVSAALAIKTGAFEGSGSGKYINTDKFKESDLNFFVQVKVTNQEHTGSDYTEFQDYNVERPRFTDVYGASHVTRLVRPTSKADRDRTHSSRAGRRVASLTHCYRSR